MSYANIKCNPQAPSNLIDRTAAGILTALHGKGDVLQFMLNPEIRNCGGDSRYRATAVKALRNIGYDIVTSKRGRWSTYTLTPAAAARRLAQRGISGEQYSRVVTFCRSMALAAAAAPKDRLTQDTLRWATGMALNVGTDPTIGRTHAEVLADIQPLTV